MFKGVSQFKLFIVKYTNIFILIYCTARYILQPDNLIFLVQHPPDILFASIIMRVRQISVVRNSLSDLINVRPSLKRIKCRRGAEQEIGCQVAKYVIQKIDRTRKNGGKPYLYQINCEFYDRFDRSKVQNGANGKNADYGLPSDSLTTGKISTGFYHTTYSYIETKLLNY